MFTPIRQILPEAVRKNSLATPLDRARIMAIFETAARARLPPEAKDAFKALHLREGVLTVACRTPLVARLLRETEAELRRSIAETGSEIRRVRFLLAPWR